VKVESLPKEIREIVEELRLERIRGATWMAARAAEAYILLARYLDGKELREGVETLGKLIVGANPTMASLYNLTRFIPISDRPEIVEERAREFLNLIDESKNEIGNIGSELVENGDVIITHSFSSAVLEILRSARKKGLSFRVILTESAPDYEGIALADELSKAGIPHEVITDAQIGLFSKEATLALVGADNITKDAAIINKAGTYPLALACHDNSVPFYVAAESFKFHPELESGDVELLERPYARNGHRVRNVLFDATPWRYVRGIITELGIIIPPREI
jgi:translation initiation factor eIF-2B subunit delta